MADLGLSMADLGLKKGEGMGINKISIIEVLQYRTHRGMATEGDHEAKSGYVARCFSIVRWLCHCQVALPLIDATLPLSCGSACVIRHCICHAALPLLRCLCCYFAVMWLSFIVSRGSC